MTSPAFGFSFGDFVLAISLIHKTYHCLQDAGGSQSEYAETVTELQHLELLLQELRDGVWSKDGADVGYINAVKVVALTCRVPLNEFLKKMERYKCLGGEKEGEEGGLRRGVLKVRWAFGMREEVERFRAVIVGKTARIGLLLQMCLLSSTSKVERNHCALAASVKKIKAEQAQILRASNRTVEQAMKVNATINDLVTLFGVFSFTAIQLIQRVLITNLQIYTTLSDLQTSILRQSSMSRGDSFRFTDALGRAEDLPYAYFQHWEIFEAYLKHNFRDVQLPGHRRVKDGHYHLLDVKSAGEGEFSIVGKHKWKTVVFPGAKIDMSMIISANFIVENCPVRQSSERSFESEVELLGAGLREKHPAQQETDFIISIADYSGEWKLSPQAGYSSVEDSTRPIPITSLAQILRTPQRLIDELTRFTNYHISIGPVSNRALKPGPRTGFQVANRQTSLQTLLWECQRVSAVQIEDTLNLLRENGFPDVFQEAFVVDRVFGHRFFHLKDDVSGLRWRVRELLKRDGIGGGLEEGEVERELERLAGVVRSKMGRMNGE